MSGKIIFLDRMLAHYGPETEEARDKPRAAVVANLDRIWAQESVGAAEVGPPSTAMEILLYKLHDLPPVDDRQRSLKAEALSVAFDLAQKSLVTLRGERHRVAQGGYER